MTSVKDPGTKNLSLQLDPGLPDQHACPQHGGPSWVHAQARPVLPVHSTLHNSNTIIKFADDTTAVGLITDNDETAYGQRPGRVVPGQQPLPQRDQGDDCGLQEKED